MRRVRTLALALASLASAAASAAAGEGDRALPVIGVSYSNGDTSKQASVGVASGCFKMPGKVIAVACIDQKAATAIDQAKIMEPYAQVSGIFTNGAKGSCSFWWEGTSAAYDALAKYPPTNVMVMAPAADTLAPSERVGFSFVLPVMENAGVASMVGNSGAMTACSLITKEQGAAAGVAIPAPTAQTTATTTTATPDAATDSAAAPTAVEKAAEADMETAPLPEPVAGDAPEVKESGVTSPAGRTAATWSLGLGALVAAAAGRALL